MLERGCRMGSKRLYQYDAIRVMAMFFVIAVHALYIVDASTPAGQLFLFGGQALFFTCNVMFFMLSGRFNLTERASEQIPSFYLRKVRGILIPVLIFFLLRTLWNAGFAFAGPLDLAKAYIKNILGGFAGTEYWFVFTLIALLIATPFLSMIFVRLTDKQVKILFGASLVLQGVQFVALNKGWAYGYGAYPFTGALFMYTMGAYCERLFETPAKARALYAVAAFSWLATTWLHLKGWTVNLHDTSPCYLLTALGLYAALFRSAPSLGWAKRPVALMSKYSFGVYMVHMVVLPHAVSVTSVAAALSPYAHYAVACIATLVLSLAASFAIDTLVIRPAQRLFDMLVGGGIPKRRGTGGSARP